MRVTLPVIQVIKMPLHSPVKMLQRKRRKFRSNSQKYLKLLVQERRLDKAEI